MKYVPPMPYFPVHLNLRDKKVVVLGKGPEVTRKIRRLEAAGAEICTDFKGAFLVMVLSSQAAVIDRGLREARKGKILVYVVNRAELSDFILPAVVERGDLVISVSTGGNSPGLASLLRKGLEKRFGFEYSRLTRLLGKKRELIKRADRSTKRRFFAEMEQLLRRYFE